MGAPAQIAAYADVILEDLNQLRDLADNSVRQGLLADAPTTASTQATGASGALGLRVDLSAGLARVNAQDYEIAPTADHVIHNAAFAWGATSSKQVIFALVLDGNSTPALADVAGTVAAAAAAIAPTDEEISTALGHDNWIRLCDVTVNRTADTTVTQTQDNTVRPRFLNRGGALPTSDV